VWTNSLSVCGISPELRSKYTILEGVYFYPVLPNDAKSLPFLSKFVGSMTSLSNDKKWLGFNWSHPVSKKEMKSHAHVIALTSDARTRPLTLHQNYFTQEFGCSFCEINGQELQIVSEDTNEETKKVRVYPFTPQELELRTHQSVRKQANYVNKLAKKNEVPDVQISKGTNGFSPLLKLRCFDVVNSISPDYVSSCLIGVVKRWTKLILDRSNRNKDFYVGDKWRTDEINRKIYSIQCPPFSKISEPPRNLSTLNFWTAAEWRDWLFYYSLPCLEYNLKEKYFEHHCLLVQAIYVLCKSEITPADRQEAETNIRDYCSEYASLYGDAEMTFDLHTLLHLTTVVIYLGPLWAHSSFLFQGVEELVKNSIDGTRKQELALALFKMSKTHGLLQTMQNVVDDGEIVLKCEKNLILGPELDLSKVAVEKLEFVKTKFKSPDLKFYMRCKVGKKIFTCEQYSKLTNTCSHFVAYKDSSGLVQHMKVLAFVQPEPTARFCVGLEIVLLGFRYRTKNGVRVKHIRLFFQDENKIICTDCNNLLYPLYSVRNCLAEPPNVHEVYFEN